MSNNQDLLGTRQNDSGWYRVNREKKKLEKEVERLTKELDFTVKAVLEGEVEVERLHEALAYARNVLRDIDEPAASGYDTYGAVEVCNKALNPPKGPSSTTKPPSDPE